MTRWPVLLCRFPDLDWPPARARAFADGAVDLWEELLQRLPTLPIGRPLSEADVRAVVAIDVPDEPLGDDELLAHLRSIVFDTRPTPGIQASWRTSPGRELPLGSSPISSRPG